MKRLLLLGSIFALLASYANSQFANLAAGEVNASSNEEGIGDKINTLLVTLNVLVIDSLNRQIPDLTHEDFTIAEDHVKQDIVFFIGADSPVNFSLAFQLSDYEPLKLMAQQTMRSFVSQVRSTDEVVLPQFKASREIVRDFSADKRKFENALSGTSSNNKSTLFDVITDANKSTNEKRIDQRWVTVVITDGLSSSDTSSG